MQSLAIILLFGSAWCVYSKSAKVEFTKKGWTLWLSNHPRFALGVALAAYSAGTFLLTQSLGVVAGVLAGLVIWMIVASLVLLFAPFQKLKALHLGLIISLLLALEMML